MHDPTLEEPPGPGEGALAELARDDHARRRFLKMVGGTGAASAFALVLAACGSSGGGQTTPTPGVRRAPSTEAAGIPKSFGTGDLAVVNYALTLEYVEAQFYKEVVARGFFSGRNGEMVKKFGAEERQHVVALQAAASKLGKPVPKPKTDFSKALTNAKTALTTAATVENVGAAAYLGAARLIQDKGILGAALTIHSIEGRHAAALNELLGRSPTPDGAFAVAMTPKQVLPLVKPFIAS